MSSILFYNPIWTANDLIGQPNSGGYINFYESVNPTVRKTVYKDSALTVPWDNPIIFDITGAQDGNYPIYGDDDTPYRVEVTDENGTPLKTFDPFPYATESTPTEDVPSNENYIINGQLYYSNAETFLTSGLSGFTDFGLNTETLLADGDWYFNKTTSTTAAVDIVLIRDYVTGQTLVPSNPKAYFNYVCEFPGVGETVKNISYRYFDVRMFSDETINIQFYAASNPIEDISVSILQYFGSGGSSSVITSVSTVDLENSQSLYQLSVEVPSISGKNIGTGDYLDIQFNLPLDVISNIQIGNFCVRIGSTIYDIQESSVNETRALIGGLEALTTEDLYTEGYNPEDGYYDEITGPDGKFYYPKAGIIDNISFGSNIPPFSVICNGYPYFQSEKYNLAQKSLTESWGTGPDGFTTTLSTATITATCFSYGEVAGGSAGTTPFTFTQVSLGDDDTYAVATILVTDGSTISPMDYFLMNSPDVEYAFYFNLNNMYKSPDSLSDIYEKTLVKIVYDGTETAEELAAIIQNQINIAQFRVPDFRGLFLRMPNFGATAVFPQPSLVTFRNTTQNLSGMVFTIYGLDKNGDSISEAINGPSSSTVTGSTYFSAITYITHSTTSVYFVDIGNSDNLTGVTGAISLAGGDLGSVVPFDGIWVRDNDYYTRTTLYTGAATGDNVGSYQRDQNLIHNHTYNNLDTGGTQGTTGGIYGVTALTGNSGGNQANPKNVYINYIIYF